MIRIAVIGYGYWGPNLVRALHATEGVEVAAICDTDPNRREAARRDHPWLPVRDDALAMLGERGLDGVAIATPVASHAPLAAAAIDAGAHVLVEKPMAGALAEARALVEQAARARRVLMVDHPYVHAPAVRRMRELVASGALGRLLYYDSVRANLGRFRPDVDVLWDLAVHDLSILDALFDAPAVEVSATGTSVRDRAEVEAGGTGRGAGHGADLAYLTVRYANGLLAHVHANWLAPLKIRRTILGGSAGMLVFDDLETSERLKHYAHDLRLVPDGALERRIGYRTGDASIPHLPVAEPLRGVCEAFRDAIATGRPPPTDGCSALRVLAVLEAADASMARRGAPVPLPEGAAR